MIFGWIQTFKASGILCFTRLVCIGGLGIASPSHNPLVESTNEIIGCMKPWTFWSIRTSPFFKAPCTFNCHNLQRMIEGAPLLEELEACIYHSEIEQLLLSLLGEKYIQTNLVWMYFSPKIITEKPLFIWYVSNPDFSWVWDLVPSTSRTQYQKWIFQKVILKTIFKIWSIFEIRASIEISNKKNIICV